MRKRLLIFLLVCFLLTLIVFALTENFEIHPVKKQTGFSAEASRSPYLALERWLAGMGHPVRRLAGRGRAEFSPADEAVVCLAAVRLDWNAEQEGRILAWINAGGHLFLYLTGAAAMPPEEGGAEKYTRLENFLAALGIEREHEAPSFEYEDGLAWFAGLDLAFKPSAENPQEGMEFFRDAYGYARLVTVRKAAGSVTVCGSPRFMRSGALRNGSNASLAWRLTGARDPDKKGVLFISGREGREGLYQTLAGRGNLVFVCVSALFVIAAGFWMVIPVFGRRQPDVPRPGRPIRERFLAEGRFLKKFHGLPKYLDAYIREIRQRLGIPAGEELSAAELASRCGLPAGDVEEAIASGKKIHFREFLKRRKILETLLERL